MREHTGSYDLAIMGGGLTGLITAWELTTRARLQNQPLPSIIILEADDAVGGRTKTAVNPDGTTINLGAHWFHGGPTNLFYQWTLKNFPGLAFSEDKVERLRSFSTTGEHGPEFRIENWNKLEALYNVFQEQRPGEDVSMGSLAAQSDDIDLQDFVRFYAINYMGVDDPAQISMNELMSDGGGPGGMQLAGGIGRLIEAITGDLRKNGVMIETATPVSDVVQDARGVHIKTTSGETVESRYALSTVSTGVIKSGTIDFQPALPGSLSAYFNGLAMAHMTKIAVPLSDAFFEQNDIAPNSHFDLIGRGDSVFCHARAEGKPVITFLLGGSEAEQIERDGPDAAATLVRRVLSGVPALKDYEPFVSGPLTVTHWNENPWTRGVWTNALPGTARQDPVRTGRVFFAGEAFVADGLQSPSTMNGAFTSAQIVSGQIGSALRYTAAGPAAMPA